MTNYELIMCIVNTGFSDIVMSAAREKGARGGTVLHARGTANKDAEEFFHITIQPDKEIVMILVPKKIRDDVLHAVYQAAGLKTEGQGISFSLPVTHAVGLTAATNDAAPKAEGDKKSESSDKKAKAETADKPTDKKEAADKKESADNQDVPADKTE
ncbi:MAG: P-II family nitrogen regulator [Clostridiales bacterium]|nr:P-II family nitrogen regulator [Clostridiales bacterium]